MKGKIFILGLVVFLSVTVKAQFTDDFTDGNFTANPIWVGQTSNYEIDAGFTLHLNAPVVTDTSYLSTPSTAISNAVWTFFVQLNFNPSSSNYAKIYLVSDQANLKGALNGYYVKIGNSSDEVSLYRQSGLTSTLIINGVNGSVNTNPVTVSVKITRDNLGNWDLLDDVTGGTTYVSEGTVLDNTHTTSTFFGVASRYTSTRSALFHYDNFSVTGSASVDNTPPVADSVKVLSTTQLDVYFNENVAAVTAQTAANYSVNLGINTPSTAVLDGTDNRLVHLTFGTAFTNSTNYNITITNVTDVATNIMATTSLPFLYFVPVTANSKDVVINEIFADPSPVVGLPAAEFVELYNTSTTTFDLSNWKFVNTTTAKTLPSFVLAANSYVILCDVTDTALYSPFGNVLGITSFTALTNSGDSLTLRDNTGKIIDIVAYNISWYQDPAKDGGGYTLELINPNAGICSGTTNWIASNAASGGTPGTQNSVFNTTPDTQAPIMDSIRVISLTQIQVYFNELMDSTALANATYTITGGISVTAVTVQSGYTSIVLNVNPSITTLTLYAFTATGVTDCSGNALMPATINFSDGNLDVTAPLIDSLKVLDANNLNVYFNEPVDVVTAQILTNYSVNLSIGNPSTALRDAIDSSIVHLTFATAFANGQSYNLTTINVEDTIANAISSIVTPFTYILVVSANVGDIVINEIFADPSPIIGLPSAEYVELFNASANVFNLSGWSFINSTTAKSLPNFTLASGSYVILCNVNDTALYSPFGNVIGITSFTALTNGGDSLTIIDNTTKVIDIVKYNISWYQDAVKDNGGYSLELINPTAGACSGASNWIASNDASGGTPGKINSVFNNTPDTQAPNLISFQILSDTTIQLFFSEIMDGLSLSNGTYTVDNGLTISNKIITSDLTTITLQLSPIIDTAIVYTITVTGVTDCQGNIISTNNSIQFTVGFEPQFGEIKINEIFADPTPQVGLPTVEYVELYNPTIKVFDLSTSNFTNAIFPSNATIAAGGYLILCPIADTAQFSPFGAVAGMTSWSSTFLTNGGKNLILTNGSGQIVDQVNYDIAWYKDGSKNKGGWSLEQINPNALCNGAINWIASNDVLGGTPGTVNSVYDVSPDTIGPNLASINILSSTSVQLNFNEPIDTSTLLLSSITIDNGLTVDSLLFSAADLATVVVNLLPQIDTSIFYTVTITGLTDCPGNGIVKNTGQFVIGVIPTYGDVIINEIMADPTPPLNLPEKEFVEFFNRSTKLLDLSGSTFIGKTIAQGTILKPNEYLIVSHKNDTAIFSSFGNVTGISSLTLGNTGMLINIKNPNGMTIDEVIYSDTWYRDNDKKNGGFTLERINPFSDCGGSANWIASNNFDGGTPGTQNSVFSTAPDTTSPSLVGVQITSANSLQITFSEFMDSLSVMNATYAITGGNFIVVTSISFENTDNEIVNLILTSNLDTAINYTLTVTNVTDCPGNMIVLPNSGTFIIGHPPTPGDLIINEIFPDENPTVGLPAQEYVEIYNTTNKLIDLSVTTFSGQNLPISSVQPKGYAVLVNGDFIADFAAFNNVVGLNTWPSLTNAGEELILAKGTTVIDKVTYSNTWYHDTDKDGGGWSLERINPFTSCNFENNWSASNDAMGGTPGKQNSIFDTLPDNIAPKLFNVLINSPFEIELFFNESMDSLSLVNGNYAIGGFTMDSLYVSSANNTSVVISYNESFVTNTNYMVTATNVSDCPGNGIGNNTFNFVLPEQGLTADLIINEVLYNPRSSGTDFVEIYNNSDRNIDLKDWAIATYDIGLNAVASTKIITTTQFVLKIGEYALVSKDSANVKAEYPLSVSKSFIQISSMPSYGDNDGVVVLLTNNSEISDRFDYNKNMQLPLLNDLNGVSLERVDFNRPTQDFTNWHSPAENVNFATPGYLNSQSSLSEVSVSDVSLAPDIFSPDDDGFNDVLNISYNFSTGGLVGNITIYDAKGRKIRLLLQQELLAVKGTISWDGFDDNKQKARIGMYIILFEAFDVTTGATNKFKKTTVLGGKL